jgi:hypothetical protein
MECKWAEYGFTDAAADIIRADGCAKDRDERRESSIPRVRKALNLGFD